MTFTIMHDINKIMTWYTFTINKTLKIILYQKKKNTPHHTGSFIRYFFKIL